MVLHGYAGLLVPSINNARDGRPVHTPGALLQQHLCTPLLSFSLGWAGGWVPFLYNITKCLHLPSFHQCYQHVPCPSSCHPTPNCDLFLIMLSWHAWRGVAHSADREAYIRSKYEKKAFMQPEAFGEPPNVALHANLSTFNNEKAYLALACCNKVRSIHLVYCAHYALTLPSFRTNILFYTNVGLGVMKHNRAAFFAVPL